MQQREPVFKGPWPVWTIAGIILASYAIQSLWLPAQVQLDWVLVPATLFRGHWTPLITAMFIHGNWAHAGLNALGALAWGAGPARLLGLGPKGALGFFLLFLACGVLSSLGYALLHLHSVDTMAGASGAVSGLLGATTRLVDHRGRLSPLATRSIIGSSVAWILVNAVMGTLHYSPGLGRVNLAWEAHIIGYFAGLLLIGPFAVLFGEPPPEDSDGSSESTP